MWLKYISKMLDCKLYKGRDHVCFASHCISDHLANRSHSTITTTTKRDVLRILSIEFDFGISHIVWRQLQVILLFLDELNFWMSTVYYTFTHIISFGTYPWEVKTGMTIHFLDEETPKNKVLCPNSFGSKWRLKIFILTQNSRALSYFKRIYL